MDSEQANTYAAMTRVSREASISCSNHEVAELGTLFLCQCPLPAWADNPHQASRAGPSEKGTLMPHVMISSKKCTGCHMCELACSAQHEGAYRPSVARLFSECNPTTGAIKGHTCLQTGCAKCQEACPNDAIVTTEITVKVKGEFPGKEKIGDTVKGYVLIVDEDACTN